MRLTALAAAFAFAGILALTTAPADAQSQRKRVVTSSGHTVFVNRDETGRKRTRVIIQKRSYLNPGTETFPGERSDHEYAFLPGQSGISVQDNTLININHLQAYCPTYQPSSHIHASPIEEADVHPGETFLRPWCEMPRDSQVLRILAPLSAENHTHAAPLLHCHHYAPLR